MVELRDWYQNPPKVVLEENSGEVYQPVEQAHLSLKDMVTAMVDAGVRFRDAVAAGVYQTDFDEVENEEDLQPDPRRVNGYDPADSNEILQIARAINDGDIVIENDKKTTGELVEDVPPKVGDKSDSGEDGTSNGNV